MKDFGILLGCAEMGVAPESFSVLEGIAETMDKSSSAERLLVKAAYDLMVATGREFEAPTYHLRFVAKAAHWSDHCREIAGHVARTLKVLEPMQKQAFSLGDAGGAAMLGLRGLGYGSLGLGAGLGSLYWLLSRHANQDDADIESMKHQVHYYNQLSKELNDSMRRKYRYERGTEQSNQPSQSGQGQGW